MAESNNDYGSGFRNSKICQTLKSRQSYQQSCPDEAESLKEKISVVIILLNTSSHI